MKILHIISSSGMYGAEAVILNLCRTLREHGHESAIAVFSNAKNPNLQLHERALAEGISSHVVPCSGQVDRSTIRFIRQLVEHTESNVVHAHGYKADIYCLLALRGRSVALVSTCHTWYDTDVMLTMYGKLDRWTLRSFDRVIAVSEEVRQRLLSAHLQPQRLRMVRNGIDLRPLISAQPSLREHLAPNSLLVGLVGRLAWEKGIDVYAAAAARVLNEFSEATFVIVGEGPDREKLEQIVKDLGIGKQFQIAGRRDDMPSVYASFDILVSASRQEGLPIALLEGMASGLPLVATTVGEVPGLVQNGQTGVLVPPGDPVLLATAILQLLRDPAKRSAMGTAAHDLVRTQYSATRMATENLEVYQEALADRNSGRPRS